MFTTDSWFQPIRTFFLQLDWKSPYTYLGILGALGAPSTIYHAGRWLRRFWHTRFLRFRYRSIHNDFYYKSRDFGYRVMEDGVTYLSVRRETIVPLKDNVEGVTVFYRWTGNGTVTECVSPNTVRIKDAPKILGKLSTRRIITFEGGLEKGKEYSYTISLSCQAKNGQPESFLSSQSSRRVDNLILRVAFPIDKRPEHVTYRMLDSDGNEKESSTVELGDPLTGEYRKHIRYPRPSFEHRIEWE